MDQIFALRNILEESRDSRVVNGIHDHNDECQE